MTAEFLTFGCRLNTYETEVMRAHAGHLTDTVVVNTCAVTAEAERQADSAIEKLAKAAARLDKTILRSPIDGVVQASIITTVGQVVTSGSDVMRIVPQDAELEIEAYLPNKDIGFVAIGDRATVKVDASRPLTPTRPSVIRHG